MGMGGGGGSEPLYELCCSFNMSNNQFLDIKYSERCSALAKFDLVNISSNSKNSKMGFGMGGWDF